MTVSISAALILGAGVFLLCRYAGLKILHAAVCIIFGFYLASSSLAPDIANITANVAIQPGWLGVGDLGSGAGGVRVEGLVSDLL